MLGHIMDSIECLQETVSELAGETAMDDEQAKWVHGERSRALFYVAHM